MRERTMLTIGEVTDILRRNKKKVTPQRLAVYAALAQTTEHPTAETLYKELRPNYPTMSLATVYKSLDAFCEIGIVRELNVGEEAFRYDADISPHPHVRCISCDTVADVPIDSLPALDKMWHLSQGIELSPNRCISLVIARRVRKADMQRTPP